MRDEVLAGVRERVLAALDEWGAAGTPVTVEVPPNPDLGDLALPTALSLARVLKRSPREIAADLLARLDGLPGVRRAEIAGPGYINLYLDRGAYLRSALAEPPRAAEPPASAPKTIIEHTNINPNKAAHIGHLRNAILGDSLARCLRFLGERVEVQNYIDDTGVQVADLVIGFQHLRKMSLDDIRGIRKRFDYYCWDLYAEVTQFYEKDKERLQLRADTLREMEEGKGRTAETAAFLADNIVRAHLRTMGRLGIRYDLLPRESDVLAHKFWEAAFRMLRAEDAIRHVESGDKAQCWTMLLPPEGGRQAEEKILVRSNGTVTYVGKDIAYQMWKFGLLDVDFEYIRSYRYDDGSLLHVTTRPGQGEKHPSFGRGHSVINVIDVRQSYLQRVVAEALRRLGHEEEASRSIHFAYEMVALTPACAKEMGLAVSDEDAERPYVEMSGRRGHGVKADDLMDRLIEKAVKEVRGRGLASEEDVDGIAASIALGALKYFMLKFVRNRVVAFDFTEVLSFEGEAGPYVQYAAVRANNIFAKLRDRTGYKLSDLPDSIRGADYEYLDGDEGNEHWQLVVEATRLREIAEQARGSLELSVLAKHHFGLAQRFNAWYHKYRVLDEEREGVRHLRILIMHLFRREMRRGLDLMGIDVPSRM